MNVKLIRDIKPFHHNKLVTVEGTIVNLGSVYAVCQEKVFNCDICHTSQLIRQHLGKFLMPRKCVRDCCRYSFNKATLTVLKNHPANV